MLSNAKSDKLIVTISISNVFHLSLKYFLGERAIIFKIASVVYIPINTLKINL